MEYLVRKRKPFIAHYWTGTDTVCRMYSTGGLVKRKYHVVQDKKDFHICTMCFNRREGI